jgi:hypothetical protein
LSIAKVVYRQDWYYGDVAHKPRELVYTPEADQTLTALENDPGRAALLVAIEDVLASIRDDPSSADLGTKVLALQVSHQVVRSTPVPDSSWYVVWSMATKDADILVIFIGPEGT